MNSPDLKRNDAPAEAAERMPAAPLLAHSHLDEIEAFVNLGRWEWNVANGAVTCSAQLLRIYGLTSGDEMSTSEQLLSKTYPSDRTRARASIMRALQTHQPFQFQQRIVRPDKTLRVLRIRGTIELDASSQPVRIHGYSQDVTEAHEADRRAQERLKLAARRTVDREEQDRSHIARLLREQVTEPLFALGRRLAGVAPEDGAPEINYSAPVAQDPAQVEQLIEAMNTVSNGTLQIIGYLRPTLLEKQGLLAALRAEASRIGRHSAIPVHVSGEETSRLPIGVENALFRVAEAALQNAAKHSGCTLIRVCLIGSAEYTRLEIQDNGSGFDAENAFGKGEMSRGLNLMRERAEAVSATFRLSSRAGIGTRISIDYRN